MNTTHLFKIHIYIDRSSSYFARQISSHQVPIWPISFLQIVLSCVSRFFFVYHNRIINGEKFLSFYTQTLFFAYLLACYQIHTIVRW